MVTSVYRCSSRDVLDHYLSCYGRVSMAAPTGTPWKQNVTLDVAFPYRDNSGDQQEVRHDTTMQAEEDITTMVRTSAETPVK